MTTANGIPYLHVLQPNQYFANDRFTDEEREKYLNLTFPPVAEIVPSVYSAFLDRSGKLAKAGVDFLDATRVFDGRGNIWIDHTCHLNEAGNLVLAELVTRHVHKRLSS
jgi:hypothetical protein